MPGYLPAHRELVYASGVAEIVGGAGVLHPKTRRAAGWWLIATLLAVFPANVEMAVHAERFKQFPRAALWARLPLAGRADRVGVADRGALAAAVAVAEAHGLRCDDAGHPARPAQRPRPPASGAGRRARGGHDRARAPGNDLAASASWRSPPISPARARPVVAPSPELPPGPHEHEGRVLSFWTYAEVVDGPSTRSPPARR